MRTYRTDRRRTTLAAHPGREARPRLTPQTHRCAQCPAYVAPHLGANFLLHGRNWARWLLAAWMGLHVVLTMGHPVQLLAYLMIFALLLFFLFRPSAAAHFRRPMADGRGRVPPFGAAPRPENGVKGEELADV